MEAFITDLFMKCVYILQVMGGAPGEYGYGYYLQYSRFCGAPTGAYPPLFLALEKGEKVEKNYLIV